MVSWGMVLRSKVGERGGELGVIVDDILEELFSCKGRDLGLYEGLRERMGWGFLYGGSADGARACALSVVSGNVGVIYAMSSTFLRHD